MARKHSRSNSRRTECRNNERASRKHKAGTSRKRGAAAGTGSGADMAAYESNVCAYLKFAFVDVALAGVPARLNVGGSCGEAVKKVRKTSLSLENQVPYFLKVGVVPIAFYGVLGRLLRIFWAFPTCVDAGLI